MTSVTYFHLPPDSLMPGVVVARPYKAVVVVEADVTNDWRNEVSYWLVMTGCLYMLAWGRECNDWEDCVDWADLELHNFDVQDDTLVMTTAHDTETQQDVFEFSKKWARHPVVEVERVLILDIAPFAREGEILALYAAALGP